MSKVKVSVVVPVYNPGEDIDDCIRTLVHEQSMPTDEYEVIFVDDGSTDETPQRLDALAAAHSHVRVEHIPNSGWPGKPRNVGTDMSRGEYVYYVDNDDWLAPEALERMYAMALADDAEIVVGKVVSTGKPVPRTLFSKNRHATNLRRAPSLISLLTPHKLFRKSLLHEHGIRYPEGRRRLEDHVFVVHAYLHAQRISVLSDYTCYHWMLRGGNASRVPFDPVVYFNAVREVLDIVEAHTEPGDYRERLMSHWYRGKIMKRVGRTFVKHEPEYQERLYAEVQRIAAERFGDWIEERLPFNLKVRSWLLRHAPMAALREFAQLEHDIAPKATVRKATRDEHRLVVRLDASLNGAPRPARLQFAQDGDRIRWVPPAALRGHLAGLDLDATDDLAASQAQVLLASTGTAGRFLVPSTCRAELKPLRDGEDGQEVVLRTEVVVDPLTAAAGSPLPEGEWQALAMVITAGFMKQARVRRKGGEPFQLTVRDGRAIADTPGTAATTPRQRLAGLAQRVAGKLGATGQ